MIISFHLMLGLGSFCMNYCINAACHGGDQPVVLLRCSGSPGCLDSGLQIIFIVGSGVPHLPIDNTPQILYGVLVSPVCLPIKHSNPMVIGPGGLGTSHSPPTNLIKVTLMVRNVLK
ncbi:hypothetical protein CHARACLAT_019997 [Characodon lateralis]|uniref:Uncharacterized protein n=1 Tax=Characodon lateralis TaxID=208331 RepID=A0ABU7D8A9_9TELE|nr:hypothetical protein [Characodon lateralis]